MLAAQEALIFDLIVKEARVDRALLTREATLETLQIDSLDTISVVFSIEEAFGIDIDAGGISKEQSLGSLLDLVDAKLAARDAAPGPAAEKDSGP